MNSVALENFDDKVGLSKDLVDRLSNPDARRDDSEMPPPPGFTVSERKRRLRAKSDRLQQVRPSITFWKGLPALRPFVHAPVMTPLIRSWLTILPLILSDLFALMVSSVIAMTIMRTFGPLPTHGIHYIMPVLSFMLVLGFLASGLYDVIGVNPVVELRQFTRLATLMLIITIAATFMVHPEPHWRRFFVWEWMASLPLLPLMRSFTRSRCVKTSWWGQPGLVFGPLAEANNLAESIRLEPSCGVRPVALVSDDDSVLNGSQRSELPVLDYRRAAQLVRRSHITYGIILDIAHGPGPGAGDRQSLVSRALAMPLSHVLVVSGNTGMPTLWRSTCECAGMAAVQVQNRLVLPWPRLVKRAIDLTLTTIGGVMISPILLLVALAVKLTSPGPIFFGHTRLGKNGRPFKAWKFRTMRKDAEAVLQTYLAEHAELREEWRVNHKLKNDPRVTPIGKFLRESSLDELPQLWNVFVGEMSLVGPRPIVQAEVEKYGDRFAQYARVKPGITGMWQVSGRSSTTYHERIGYDDYYVQNWSPWLDVHLMTRTLSVVVKRSGAY
jgi:Undecaprenyl-phosphate galactose phosphotransferase WbaP